MDVLCSLFQQEIFYLPKENNSFSGLGFPESALHKPSTGYQNIYQPIKTIASSQIKMASRWDALSVPAVLFLEQESVIAPCWQVCMVNDEHACINHLNDIPSVLQKPAIPHVKV